MVTVAHFPLCPSAQPYLSLWIPQAHATSHIICITSCYFCSASHKLVSILLLHCWNEHSVKKLCSAPWSQYKFQVKKWKRIYVSVIDLLSWGNLRGGRTWFFSWKTWVSCKCYNSNPHPGAYTCTHSTYSSVSEQTKTKDGEAIWNFHSINAYYDLDINYNTPS